ANSPSRRWTTIMTVPRMGLRLPGRSCSIIRQTEYPGGTTTPGFRRIDAKRTSAEHKSSAAVLLVAPDEVERQAERLQVLTTVEGKFSCDAELCGFGNLVAGAEGHVEVGPPGAVHVTDVRQVTALDVQVPGRAGAGVLEVVEFHQRVELVPV